MTGKNSDGSLSQDLERDNAFREIVKNVLELEEIIAERKDEIKDVLIKAKADGFNVKALKQVIREKKSPNIEARIEYEATVDEYRDIIGLLVC